ncbi:MFS transporter [Aspergillus clavatus NRRL 1]|uniref:MFS multidrug transporter, putative n=1 Tax=Aspergillus clavatus (strain ATCC 1007 / CBS 513.65 / DSM 816 / NCTC 3887 / NRRL 1 / QM 1276 / 107) TaxID=344612 RepID=A1CSA3_ASPCL|nr:MFS multidrug transporter, putative [Aspergillus clavatus NRRL 1]EAW08524.1 MFS multidrug transporter, putative [Aspergillus clavatus NRRL 1]
MNDLEKQRPPSPSHSHRTEYLSSSPPQSRHSPTHEPRDSPEPEVKRFPETDLARGVVGWDGQDDPENPQNFSGGQKWSLLALMSSITLISPLASSMFSPAVEFVAADLKVTDPTLLSFSVTVFLLGYTFGPLLIAPLSEIYGRRILLSFANWFFVVWQIGCALAPNIALLIVFRLLAGIGGAGCITLGAGLIVDLFPVEKRGMATSIWSMGPLIGPVVGPICGGFIGQQIGWRWIFWILLIASGALSFGIECSNRETYAPVLIRWKTAKLAKELGRTDLRSAYEPEGDDVSAAETVKLGLKRPMLMFFKSPIVFLLSVYMSLVYGLLYLFFTTIPAVFTAQYGFTTGLSGLAYLGIGIGFFIGLAIIALTSDRIVMKLTAQNSGRFEPEMRLPTMIFFSCFLPVSFFWYGWSAAKHVHWIVPIIGMCPFGISMMGLFMPIQTYIIDCYPAYAASASAVLTATRSLVGALLPLAGPEMFKSLGLGWGNSLLGFIAVAFVPIPIFFTGYGKAVREKFPVDFNGKKG